MSEYFPKLDSLEENIKVELYFSNYATKTDLKNATGVDTLSFAKKTDLACLKYDVDKLDIDELTNVPINLNNLKSKVDKLNIGILETTPVDLNKLSNAVKNDVVKKDAYNAKMKHIEDKIPDITNLATNTTNTSLNAKINEVKREIPSITDLATTTVLTAIENKIPNVSNLIKKLNITHKLVKLKRKLLIVIMIIILLLQSLMS